MLHAGKSIPKPREACKLCQPPTRRLQDSDHLPHSEKPLPLAVPGAHRACKVNLMHSGARIEGLIGLLIPGVGLQFGGESVSEGLH